MNSRWAGFMAILILISQLSFSVYSAEEALDLEEEEEPFIAAEYAVLMDADTGQILYEKGMLDRAAPASITKVMTGLLVVENGTATDLLEASETAIHIPGESTAIWLQEGEILTVEEAMYAMMLRSANDAANLLAEYVSGTQEEFARRMNRRAYALGAKNTNFVNASGLPHPNHYTTAYDMALITLAAIQNEAFVRYFGWDYYTMAPTNLGEERYFTNGQSMLLEESDFYDPQVIGGKVGYTDESRHTMVTAARRAGQTLICVVMGCERVEKFTDTQTLLDYGFTQLQPVIVTGQPPEILPAEFLENGEVAGEVSWPLEQQQWTILVPRGYSADDIAVEYQIPQQQIHDGQALDARIVIRPTAQGDLLPSFFLEIPLEAVIDRLEPVSLPAAEPTPSRTPSLAFPFDIKTAIALSAAAGSLGIAIILWVVMAKKRRRRIRYKYKKYKYTYR